MMVTDDDCQWWWPTHSIHILDLNQTMRASTMKAASLSTENPSHRSLSSSLANTSSRREEFQLKDAILTIQLQGLDVAM